MLRTGSGSGKRSMSRLLQRAVGRRHRASAVTVEHIVTGLGERSFGWVLFLFALVNLMPLPYGATLVTAVPLLWVSMQMSMGYRYVHLPRWLLVRPLSTEAIQRTILWTRPVLRAFDRVLRPRLPWVFWRTNEQLIGLMLFLVALALFLPLPLTGWLPALSLLMTSVGLIERDGVVILMGLGVGVFAVVITAVVVFSLLVSALTWF
jgi:hypothetical protein